MARNAVRQPVSWPAKVPAGTPRHSATGIPAMAMAMARPCRAGATRRRAYPASSAHARPAATPATNRATIVRLYSDDTAVTVLATANPAIAVRSNRLRRQPAVIVDSGIAVSTVPSA
ncbi:hypothetical protein A4R44_03749 [Amycolatopsis sp. M39]|nr:hypothetical protein A4R44_03749 [Amycolatopsis sp. M39]